MTMIERVLDRLTMYQVVLGSLGALVFLSFVFSFFTLVPYAPLEIVALLAALLGAAVVTHYIGKRLWRAPANLDSTLITALILFFLFSPSVVVGELGAAAGAAALAVASKYVLAYRHVHIFNPVAVGVVLTTAFGIGFATWWVATPWLFPFVAVSGLLVAMKLRRLDMVLTGLIVAFAMQAGMAWREGFLDASFLTFLFVASPLVFFFTFMVTEPLSTPGRAVERIAYAAFIGVLVSVPFFIGPVFNAPELTLLIANALAYPLLLRQRVSLTLKELVPIAQDTYEAVFTLPRQLTFKAGQYLEWTLPHQASDRRGIRRYFTIASSPNESVLRLGFRQASNGSTFKQALVALEPGSTVYATSRAGDFVLPDGPHKYLFAAGGIGITPFVSQVRTALLRQEPLDAVLLYFAPQEADLAYLEVFKEAKELGFQVVPCLTEPAEDWTGERGFMTQELLERVAPDFRERLAYVSGPPGMVAACSSTLKDGGVPKRSIKTDYFPGLA